MLVLTCAQNYLLHFASFKTNTKLLTTPLGYMWLCHHIDIISTHSAAKTYKHTHTNDKHSKK